MLCLHALTSIVRIGPKWYVVLNIVVVVVVIVMKILLGRRCRSIC